MLIMNELTNEGTLNQVSLFFFLAYIALKLQLRILWYACCHHFSPRCLFLVSLILNLCYEGLKHEVRMWVEESRMYMLRYRIFFLSYKQSKDGLSVKKYRFFFCSLRLLPKSSHNQKSLSCLAPQAPTLCHWNHVYARFCLSHTQQQVISLISSSPLTEGVLISDIKCSSVCCCRCTAFYTSKQSSSHFWSPD